MTELEAWGHNPLPLAPAATASHDLAFSPNDSEFPRARASFTSAHDRLDQVNDLQFAFTRYSRNRWTAYGSPHASDWVEIDFGESRVVRSVELYFWGDSTGVKAPRKYAIQYWTGSRWADASVVSRAPAVPTVSAMNLVRVKPLRTSRIRAVFEHDLPAFTGLTELVIPDS
jgi:hypothetical protein